MSATKTTVADVCNRISAAAAKGALRPDDINAILSPFIEEMMKETGALCERLTDMNRRDAAWTFSLPGGMAAKVNFSGDIERRHVQAFSKVFAVMCETWLETEA